MRSFERVVKTSVVVQAQVSTKPENSYGRVHDLLKHQIAVVGLNFSKKQV
jgi:hypothetical protein